MDITFKGRHTSVPERFRRHATVKLAKLERLDQKAIRIDVEVSKERNPRQSDRSERVELTIRSRGPAIRAEAAADDRYAALDLAFAKLEGRLRRSSERRKTRHSDVSVRSVEVFAAVTAPQGAAAAAAPAGPAGAVRTEEGPPGGVAAPEGAAAPNGARRRKVNGRVRPEAVVPLPTLPDDDRIRELPGRCRGRGGGVRPGADPDGGRGSPDRQGEVPCLAPDDHRSGAFRDGTRRPRLLRVPRQPVRQVQRGLPPLRVRLWRNPPGRGVTACPTADPGVPRTSRLAPHGSPSPQRWRAPRSMGRPPRGARGAGSPRGGVTGGLCPPGVGRAPGG